MFTWRRSRWPYGTILTAGVAAVAVSFAACAGTGIGAGALGDQLQPNPPHSSADAASSGAAYAAFGDSYSAGEGTNHYLPGTDVKGVNVCHHSTSAHSQVLTSQAHFSSTAFAACSGALTADLFAPNNNHNAEPNGTLEPAQLCQAEPSAGIEPCGTTRAPALGADMKMVTLTIGGNDVGFAKVVESCVFGQAGRYLVGLPGSRCRFDPVTIDRAAHRIAALAGHGSETSPHGSDIHSLSSALAAIHVAAPPSATSSPTNATS